MEKKLIVEPLNDPVINNGADAFDLHNYTHIFEEKFSELIGKNPLTLGDKKCLIKLYIVLRTNEKKNIANSAYYAATPESKNSSIALSISIGTLNHHGQSQRLKY